MFNSIVYQFSSTAAENKIDNSANDEVLKNIKELDEFLDIAYASWIKYTQLNGIPEIKFVLYSGYRCKELNSLLGGSETSPHLTGYAADISIKNLTYFKYFYKWVADFAKDCAQKNIKYDQIILETSGSYEWAHFSLKDFNGGQQMQSIIINPENDSQIQTIIYGQPTMTTTTDTLTTNPMTLKHQLNKTITNKEIEGSKGENKMDLDVMPGTYMRCIYIMKRLMTSFCLTAKQAAGITGNIIADTDGKISTTKNLNGLAGICQWDYKKQVEFRKVFLNDDFLETSNLMNQVSFLIKDIVKLKILRRLQSPVNVNDSCYAFFKNYKNYGKKIDCSDLKTKKELSLRRAYSKAAYELYERYIDVYKDEWLVGYYTGNGLTDGPAIQKTDDTKLWESATEPVTQEEINTYASYWVSEANKIDELMKDYGS